MATGLSLDSFKGKIVIVAQFIAQDGQADKLASIFKQMRDHSMSDADPGTTLSKRRNVFKDAASVTTHSEDPKLKAWLTEVKGGNFLARPPQIKLYGEL
ncbi:hypothetical protein FRC11_007132 [Ceratobasidium sp. 423]|nr:hypothetical protein FRC11_007132 [Ceratobasidium sp. 423]